MFNRLQKRFNDRATRREERQLLSSKITVLYSAIRTGDEALATLLFNDVKSSVPTASDTYAGLLRGAIEADNVPAFALLAGALEDPNYHFTSYNIVAAAVRAPSPSMYRTEHVLHAAIIAGSRNIALHLANDARVSVDNSGFSQVLGLLPARQDKLTPPAELAKARGMDDVAAVITHRLAAQKRPAPPVRPKLF